jgi:hypothetical protein
VKDIPNDRQRGELLTGTPGAFAKEFKDLVAKTDLTLERLASRVSSSKSTLSRCTTGQQLPSDRVLISVCEVAKVPDDERIRLLQLLVAGRADHPPMVAGYPGRAPEPARPRKQVVAAIDRRPITAPCVSADSAEAAPGEQVEGRQSAPWWRFTALRRFVVRRPWTTMGVLVTAAVLVALAVIALRPSGAGTSDQRDARVSPTLTGGCDRYEIAPRDLLLRDEYGDPLRGERQLRHGQQVTVENRGGGPGSRYWYVKASDGRRGWVDPDYLRPLC